jgi:ribonuclease HI
VKQGCPLSPTLFILTYDVLLDRLMKQGASITPRAAADDLAISSPQLARLIECFSILDSFAHNSGLGINRNKTGVISTRRASYGDVQALKLSLWPEVKVAKDYKYLGVKVGREVTPAEVFREALGKAYQRVQLFSGALLQQSMGQRIRIFNSYITPLFSYLQQFFLIPDSVLAAYRSLVSRAVIPAAGTAFKYHHLVCQDGALTLSSPLRDLWAGNIMALTQKVSPGVYRSWLPPGSMRIWEHRWFARDSYLFYHCQTPSRGWEDNKVIYKRLVDSRYARIRRKDLIKKLSSGSIRTGDPEGILLNLEAQAGHLRELQPAVREFHLRCVLNAVFTRVRSRWIRLDVSAPRDPSLLCRLCRQGADDIRHWFSTCTAVRKAVLRTMSGAGTTMHLDEEDYLFLLNGPPGNLRAVKTLLTTLWAAWVVACRVERTKETEISKIINLIVSKASEKTTDSPAQSRFGSAGSRTKEQKDNAWNYFQTIQTRIPPNAITVYTDGSSLGNPGPAGAGAWVRFLDRDFSLWAPLGTGTNNEGEVWAIGMALAFLRRFPDLEVHFFSDSEYALKGVKGFRSRGSLPIHLWLRLIKSHLRKRPGKVGFHWVPGHLGIDGNEKADLLAKKGATASQDGKPPPEPLFGFFEAT